MGGSGPTRGGEPSREHAIASARPTSDGASSSADARHENGFRAEIIETPGEKVLVLRGGGELDLSSRHEARSAVTYALRTSHKAASGPWVPPAGLVVDLRATTYLSATVVAALIVEARRTPTLRRARLVICRAGVAARVVATLGLDEIFDVFDDLDDALTHSAAPSTRPSR